MRDGQETGRVTRWRTRAVPAGEGTTLWVTEAGADPEGASCSIVLSHGWSLTHQSWAAVVGRLVRAMPDVHVVCYDHRGHGESGPVRSAPTAATLADDLAQVIEATRARKVVLGGHSLGGVSCMAYAHRHRNRFRSSVIGTVLAATAPDHLTPVGLPAENLLMWLGARTRHLAPGRLISRRRVRRTLFGPRPSEDAVRATTAQLRSTPMRTTALFHAGFARIDERPGAQALLSAPLRIVTGARDQFFEVADVTEWHQRLRGSELTVVPEAGHMVTYEATPHIAAALAHLARHVPVRPQEGARR